MCVLMRERRLPEACSVGFVKHSTGGKDNNKELKRCWQFQTNETYVFWSRNRAVNAVAGTRQGHSIEE